MGVYTEPYAPRYCWIDLWECLKVATKVNSHFFVDLTKVLLHFNYVLISHLPGLSCMSVMLPSLVVGKDV